VMRVRVRANRLTAKIQQGPEGHEVQQRLTEGFTTPTHADLSVRLVTPGRPIPRLRVA